jgi:hypothetical protein
MGASKARRARKARRRMALSGGPVTVCRICGERLADGHEIALGRHLACQPRPREIM